MTEHVHEDQRVQRGLCSTLDQYFSEMESLSAGLDARKER